MQKTLRNTVRWTLIGVAIALASLESLRAQWPQPWLSSVAPLGVSLGGSVEVTLRGTNLDGVTSLWFDDAGLSASHLKDLTFRVTCAPGTSLGQHDVRAVGRWGVSNPRTIVVDNLPQTSETEPNNTPDHANKITINSVAHGEISSETDVDCFAFEGTRGQRVFLDLSAERVESRLDATLRVFGPDGREVAEDRDTFGVDPFIDLTLPTDGRYVVKVHDVIYRGSSDSGYRLRIHTGPHLDAVQPTVARAGVASTFTLLGRNLGGESAPGLEIAGRPLERKVVTITPPAESEPGTLAPWRGYWSAPALARHGFEWSLESSQGTSNPIFIATTTDPIVVESEPNGAEHPQEVTLPCDISGTFGTLNDLDVFRFRGRKGELWRIEAQAEALGSLADPLLEIQMVNERGATVDLANADDQTDQTGAGQFDSTSVDASTSWRVPSDGLYQVMISDRYSSQRGDPRLVYRLHIRPERPDFRVIVVPPGTTTGQGRRARTSQTELTIRAGGRTTANLLAWRLDGFNGPIQIEARNLPPGIHCEPVVIAAGRSSMPIVFEADEAVQPVVARITLIGRSRLGDRKEDLSYVSGATPLGPDLVHDVLSGTTVWPPTNTPNVQQRPIAPARLTRGLVLAVREPAPFTLNVQPDHVVVTQGQPFRFDLSLTRRADFQGNVSVNAAELPPNVANVPTSIGPKASSTATALVFPANVPPGPYTFLFRGTASHSFTKDPSSKNQTKINLDEPSNPITVIVRPAPLSLALASKGRALKQGGLLEVDATIERRKGFDDGVTLALKAPARLKLSADPVQVAPGQKTARIVVRAAADSPPGATATVAVRASATFGGEAVEVDQRLPLTINK
jgi:hypothetical protein